MPRDVYCRNLLNNSTAKTLRFFAEIIKETLWFGRRYQLHFAFAPELFDLAV